MRVNILVYHIGSLGDTLVAVPALWAVRENYPDAYITMLTDEQPGQSLVQARDILNGSSLIDDYIVYPAGKLLAKVRLIIRLRARKFDKLVYLLTAADFSSMRVARDCCCFMRLVGIKTLIGTRNTATLPRRRAGVPLPTMRHVADTLLTRLRTSGLEVPQAGMGRCDIGSLEYERIEVAQWLADLPSDGGRSWIALGLGSKMPTRRWPIERYAEVTQKLIEEFDIWPVVFGGPESRTIGESLVLKWGRGYVAAGYLGVRSGIAALEKAKLYLGNDTGTMHMAVAAGLRCVAIFSARNYPGRWDPYGKGHVVFRVPVSCEGCLLETCVDNKLKCLRSINTLEVFEACQDILRDIQ